MKEQDAYQQTLAERHNKYRVDFKATFDTEALYYDSCKVGRVSVDVTDHGYKINLVTTSVEDLKAIVDFINSRQAGESK